ncbi:hypothetical protein E4U43_004314 [Claviceps pusilla]|uniref:Uncharacterized protein n=1 Tax=Claviceps pusilla TaxID=123648 RepID=A0A9P7SU16_9HYPO|nr:hypothetical protein E4U43_004314 [Claviceps pusilla]
MKTLGILAVFIAAAVAIPAEANTLERRCQRSGQYCDTAAIRCCSRLFCCGDGATGRCVERWAHPPNQICV